MRNALWRRMSPLLARLGGALLLVTLSSLFIFQHQFAAATALPGRHVLPSRAAAVRTRFAAVHETDRQQQLHLSISLNLRQRAALDALLASQNDPTSPAYHHYLTPQQFAAAFGPTQATVDSVVAFLQGQGLTVTQVASNHALITAIGSVANVEKAFGVTLNDYQVDGRIVYAPASDPTVPDALGDAILNIEGLDNLVRFSHASLMGRDVAALGPRNGYTPAELRSAYDVNALLQHGGTGAGQTTALFELDGYNPTDISTYLTYYQLGTPKYSDVLVDGATNTPGVGAVEVELDMEVLSALAPDAAQKVYIGPNTVSGVNDIYNRIVTDNLARVVSISWGSCEPQEGDAELTALDNIFAQGAAQGQAFFAASGDSGAYDCRNGSTLAVDSPSDDPYVVGVGGTSLQVQSDGSYGSESAWSNASKGEGGGGGISAHFTQPAYQHEAHLPGLNRETPDVSADADPRTGYSIYCTTSDPICARGWGQVGGTSAAAPLWAGLATDSNAYLAQQGKPGLGGASASLYALYHTKQAYSAYHDVTAGDNLYYKAAVGYDMASGIGTPDGWNIARDLLTLPPVDQDTTQLLQNPGFDNGSQAWSEEASGSYEIVDTTNPHAGDTSADLCGYTTCNDRIGQSVTLPLTARKVVLSYWVYASSPSAVGICTDVLTTRLHASNGAIITTPQQLCNTQAKGWKQYSFDLTWTLRRYAGKRITVEFQATTSAATVTAFFVDDVALTASRS